MLKKHLLFVSMLKTIVLLRIFVEKSDFIFPGDQNNPNRDLGKTL